jgi:hypothetical protein
MGVRETLLAATATPTEVVRLPELGIEVTVRGMTGVERDAFESSCIEGKGRKREFSTKNLRAKLVAYCCIDDNGHRVFTDADAVALGAVRADVIDKLFSVAQRLSGMRDEDVEELGIGSAKTTVLNTPSSPSANASA